MSAANESHRLRSNASGKPQVKSVIDEFGNIGWHVRYKSKKEEFKAFEVCELFSRSNHALKQAIGGRRALVMLDPEVDKNYGQKILTYFQHHGIDHCEFRLPPCAIPEDNKSFEMLRDVVAWILSQGEFSKQVLVVIGGGVAIDLGGTAVGFTRRGYLPFLAVPTTLIAVVDAAVSRKTAINVGSHKNGAGLDYPPEQVLYDPCFLRTLDRWAIVDGITEMLKIAIVRDRALFDAFDAYGEALLRMNFQTDYGRRVIRRSIHSFLKSEAPRKEPSIRSFGHGFSRLLESDSRYRLTHGQAVAIELRIATILSWHMGYLPMSGKDRILSCFDRLDLPKFADVCDTTAIWDWGFARRFTSGVPFHFPIPGHDIGAGEFLNCFTKEELAAALYVAKQLAGRQILCINNTSASAKEVVVGRPQP